MSQSAAEHRAAGRPSHRHAVRDASCCDRSTTTRRVAVAEGIYRSGGCTAAYMLLTDSGRVIVNTGMGFEAPHHRRVFDAVRPGPTHYIVTTQGHVDHLGGVDLFKDVRGGATPVYVAQENNQACQADDARIRGLRMRTAGIWFDTLGTDARRIFKENPGVSMQQSEPVPDVTVGERLELDCDGLRIELIAAVGETVDSLIVWLPGAADRAGQQPVRSAVPPLPEPEHLAGRPVPIRRAVSGERAQGAGPASGRARHGSLRADRRGGPDRRLAGRLAGAVDYVHQRALEGFNEGTDVWTLMESISLPARVAGRPGLRDGPLGGAHPVGELRGLVQAGVDDRALSRLRPGGDHRPGGCPRADCRCSGAGRGRPGSGRRDRGHPDRRGARRAGPGGERMPAAAAGARSVLARAHTHLLEHGGDVSFWENGWLRDQLARWGSDGA